jgi:serine/threonine-protein kinase HipA
VRRSTLLVWAGTQRVGQLQLNRKTNQYRFDYDPTWIAEPNSYPLSPSLPFTPAIEDLNEQSARARNFFENLLPEGQALESILRAAQISRGNIVSLLFEIGRETTGALTLLPEDQDPKRQQPEKRLISTQELSERIRTRPERPFNIWDRKARLSIAGYQDKLAVYEEDGALYLADGSLASTHILKPESINAAFPQLVANEHFCLKIADAIGLKTAEAHILRVPEPVLMIERFDRLRAGNHVERKHIIDACQVLNLPSAEKYELIYGSGRDVAHIREGASLSKIFSISEHAIEAAIMRRDLLRWTLLQTVIGNSDAHGKNLSFYVERAGLTLTPVYDLVSVNIYPDVDGDLAMAIGDEFTPDKIRAYDWMQFAEDCGIEKRLLQREAHRIFTILTQELPRLVQAPDYDTKERQRVEQIADLVRTNMEKLRATLSLI